MTLTVVCAERPSDLASGLQQQKTKVEECGMVYSDDCQKAPVSHSADERSVTIANELLINLSLGKLNSYAKRESLFRNVMLQNILNERVQERDDGLQCYGQVRMHEVRLMVDRQRKLDHESMRTWDDEAAMQTDHYMHQRNISEEHGVDYKETEDIVECERQQENESGDVACDDGDTSTDEDECHEDANELINDGQLTCVQDIVSKAERPPYRIKLVLRKADGEVQISDTMKRTHDSTCSASDVANPVVDSRACKRQRLNSTGSQRNASVWPATRRLSSVF